jgi:hypothetical protein
MLEVRLSRGRLRRLKANQTRGALLMSVSLSDYEARGGERGDAASADCRCDAIRESTCSR